MKCKLITFLFVIISFPVVAQTNFGEGVVNLNFGVGFPNKTHTAIDAGNQLFGINGEENGSSTPFYNLSANYGLTDAFDVGLFVGYFKSDSEIISILSLLTGDDFGQMEYSVFSVGGKATVHQQLFPAVDQLDTYASTYLGYNFVNEKADLRFVDEDEEIIGINVNDALTRLVSNANFPEITYEVNAGAKYAFSENSSVFAEAGYGRFLINAGYTYTIQ